MTSDHRLLSKLSWATLALFLVLFGASLAGGVSQQWFEHVRAPAAYAEALRRGAVQLRALVVLDDVFIAAYTAVAVLWARTLGATAPALAAMAGAAALAAGVLDHAENHHLLALLAAAELGLEPTLAELVGREQASAVKWLLAHAGFFWAGLALDARTPAERLFRGALLVVQLPVGALAWAVTAPAWVLPIAVARAAGLAAGFGFIAWSTGRPDGGAAAATGARA